MASSDKLPPIQITPAFGEALIELEAHCQKFALNAIAVVEQELPRLRSEIKNATMHETPVSLNSLETATGLIEALNTIQILRKKIEKDDVGDRQVASHYLLKLMKLTKSQLIDSIGSGEVGSGNTAMTLGNFDKQFGEELHSVAEQTIRSLPPGNPSRHQLLDELRDLKAEPGLPPLQ